ncbi:50S ribosomal protein L10 [Patescibacteria group bacterium]|nr:50S ribosomal protein L10 [Patescibacteria group bacterium]
MAIKKDKKKSILEKLDKIFKEAKEVAFVNFHGLSVHNATELRKHLKGSKVGYFVAKKTLIRKAFEGKKVEGEIPNLLGEIGVAWSSEVTVPSREVYTFGKKLDQGIKLVGGVFDGKFMDEAGMTSIAMIPGRKTLEAQFVNLINSPIQRFVVSLDQIAKKKTS